MGEGRGEGKITIEMEGGGSGFGDGREKRTTPKLEGSDQRGARPERCTGQGKE